MLPIDTSAPPEPSGAALHGAAGIRNFIVRHGFI
jgi:hypothetical protein